MHSAIRFFTPDARHDGNGRTKAGKQLLLIGMYMRKNRHASQARPATVNPPDPSGLTLKGTFHIGAGGIKPLFHKKPRPRLSC